MKPISGNNRAYSGGGQARFRSPPMTEPVSREIAALKPGNGALIEGRTVYTSRVFDASERDHVLVEGINNAKTGNRVTVGPWAGMRMWNLSLEERATCPRSCAVWAECFGNGMPLAVRFRYTPSLMAAIAGELRSLSSKHHAGYVVRLHILGDFPDVAYVRRWLIWLRQHRALHVWGYTAHGAETPIGKLINQANGDPSGRWRVRFSVANDARPAPMQVTTVWTKPKQYNFDPESSSMVCPQEIGKTDHCATCGICWHPKLEHVRVTFMGHGGHGRGAQAAQRPTAVKAPPEAKPVVMGSDDAAVQRFISLGGVTRLPAGRAHGLPK